MAALWRLALDGDEAAAAEVQTWRHRGGRFLGACFTCNPYREPRADIYGEVVVIRRCRICRRDNYHQVFSFSQEEHKALLAEEPSTPFEPDGPYHPESRRRLNLGAKQREGSTL